MWEKNMIRLPKQKPLLASLNHQYAAILASYCHCHNTCLKGLEHVVPDIHDFHEQLHDLPTKQRTKEILDAIFEDYKKNVNNITPQNRAIFENSIQVARWHLGIIQPYPFPLKEA
jgi:hypothetical protein